MAAIFAEFDSPEAIIGAAARLRALGHTGIQSYTPFPIPALERELGLRRTRIPAIVLACGCAGLATAYLILWFCNAFDYPLNVGGRPLSSILPDVPIMFETTVLFAGGSAFASALLSNGLPRLHDDVSEVAGIERASVDRYWIRLEATNPGATAGIVGELERLGALGTQEVDLP